MADYTQQGLYQEGNSLFDDIFAFGDLEVQNINVVGIITAKTFSGVDATSLKDDGGTVKIQATTTGATHSGRAVFNEVELQGKVYDSDGDFGTSGQVLSSDGTDIEWVNAGSLSAGSAAQISVSEVTNQTLTFPIITGNSSGNQTPRSNTNLTFDSTNGTLSSTSFSGNLTGDVTGTIQTASQTNITSVGTLTGLTVNGTVNVQNGNLIQLRTSSGNLRGYIQSTETNDQHLIIATSGGEDIAFKDGGVGGTTNMVIRGDGNVVVSNGGVTASSFTGDLTGDVNATTVSGTLQTASQTNITSVGILNGLEVDGNVLLDNTSRYLSLKGALLDKDGETGANGEVLVSTGSQVDWQNPNTLTASNSIKVTITENDNNNDFPITFSIAAGQSGGNTLHSDNQFTYNASANVVTAGTFSGSGASLTSLNASNINSGTLPDARLSNSSLFVTGMIIMWNSTVASIPTGWVLCDGNNSTPDLRNRFVVGAGTGGNYSPGDTGGADSVTLTLNQIPAHTHTWDRQDVSINNGYRPWPANNNDCSRSTQNTGSAGGGQSHENRPPYYALCYIMKT